MERLDKNMNLENERNPNLNSHSNEAFAFFENVNISKK